MTHKHAEQGCSHIVKRHIVIPYTVILYTIILYTIKLEYYSPHIKTSMVVTSPPLYRREDTTIATI